VLVAIAGGIALFSVLSCSSSVKQAVKTVPSAPPGNALTERSSVDPRTYTNLRAKISNERIILWSRYQRANTTNAKEAIIAQARQSFVRSVYDEIFPYWYGTGWDFYGTTETPGQGKIACGYFVSTVLRDLGMNVQRAKLAQQASENIVLSLTTNDHTRRFRRVSIDSFIDSVRNWGTGLYVVGLDIHVGFILNVDGDVYFIHSSYVDPFCVIKERGVDSRVLASSNYRVLGKLSEDDDLILKWLRGDPFPTRVT
jgi:hypothetical protein